MLAKLWARLTRRPPWDDFWSVRVRVKPLPPASSDRWIDYWGQP